MEKISTVEKPIVCTESRLEELIDSYDKLVFSICYKLTGDYFAAEDLAQETFLSAFQKYETFDGTNEKAWICRIATNKSIDYLRSASRRNVPTEDTFFETAVENKGSPEDICMEEEIKEQLERRCEGLKPPYNEVARAYYLEELSPREIALRLGQNVKTIQTQIYRAREMLRKIYGKEEPV
ncbi:MAG: RNA polymerase sigma factor [Bacillota bacterium]|nr:RNA polymerase sigma factor [Bacillota bacterium]